MSKEREALQRILDAWLLSDPQPLIDAIAAARAVLAQPEADSEVEQEVQRATAKFPTWPTDPLHALAVLGEEFGELTKAVLQHTYEPHKSTRADVRTEAVQTAAMALRFLISLDRYEYRHCAQHRQDATAMSAEQEGK